MNKSKKTGMTLIEIMVAILLVVVLVGGVASVLSYSGSAVVRQGNARMVMEIVDEALERIRATDFDALANSTRSVTRDGNTYAVSTSVLALPSPAPRKEATIQVTYREQVISVKTIVIQGFAIQN